MSDFHEMASTLRMRKKRSLTMENPAYGIDKGGRRLGIDRRQFTYSYHTPERRVGFDRRNIPERRDDSNAGTQQ